jgi:hypothetical protein
MGMAAMAGDAMIMSVVAVVTSAVMRVRMVLSWEFVLDGTGSFGHDGTLV